MHDGSIEATSEGPGRGSRFTIALPLRADASPGPGAAHREDAPARVAHRRLLVVDDNVDAARTLQMMLELDGHSVRTVHDGRSALAACAAERFDAVLLDIGLPDVDGLDVARRLRAGAGGACPRLIALSGWGRAGDKQRALEAGFERHLTKPVDGAALAAALARPPAEAPRPA
jgi:CheY-like chemotaxis protein